MSLKAFHIAFIVVSTLLAFGFAAWSVAHYRSGGNANLLIVAGLSLFAGMGLIFYGIRFLKKLKHVSYI